MDAVIAYLNDVPLASLMLVVSLGFVVGRVSWRGVWVGTAASTLVVALLLGHLGLSLRGLYGEVLPPVTVGLFGFALFIYSVGFEAGPRFFASLTGRTGWRFVLAGALVNVLAVATAVGVGTALDLDASTVAGILAGALTSAPTYAAASEVAPQPDRLSVAFAVAYPVGFVGLVTVIQVLPRVWSAAPDPTRPSEDEDSRAGERRLRPQHGAPEVTRVYRAAREPALGVPLRELDLTHRTGGVIQRIRRGDELLMPHGASVLRKDDVLSVTGRVDELHRFEELVGPEEQDDLLGELHGTRRIEVTNPQVFGCTLAELDLIERFGVVAHRIESGETLIEPTARATVQKHDVVELVGEPEALGNAASYLGRLEPPATRTNIAIYAAGILLGVLLGNFTLRPLGVDFTLGLAGGLLIAGLVLGRFRRIGPFSANVPLAARQLVRDLGILLFVAEIGLGVGEQLTEGGGYALWQTALGGLVVMMVPLVAVLLLARHLFHMAPLDALGSVCGGMTSSAALVVLKRAAARNDPAVTFAAAYAVASVLVTMSGHVVVWLM